MSKINNSELHSCAVSNATAGNLRKAGIYLDEPSVCSLGIC